MRLSVIVPTHNQRDELAACLDSIADSAPEAEVIVVNGPSTDGTSGMVRERGDVDVLLDCASRNINVARNAGLLEASGEVFALLAPSYRIQPGWLEAVVESLDGEADLVSGPVRVGDPDPLDADPGGLRIVGGNLAMTRAAVRALDGFDDYLVYAGTTDLDQRITGQNLQVVWHPEMAVRAEPAEPPHRRQHRGGYETAWGSADEIDWASRYRSLAYRTVKNDGLGVRSIGRLAVGAVRDGVGVGREVLHGGVSLPQWAGTGWGVLKNSLRGIRDGFRARRSDRTAAANPHGLSQTGAGVVVDRHGS